jgi:hypothetical protein
VGLTSRQSLHRPRDGLSLWSQDYESATTTLRQSVFTGFGSTPILSVTVEALKKTQWTALEVVSVDQETRREGAPPMWEIVVMAPDPQDFSGSNAS